MTGHARVGVAVDRPVEPRPTSGWHGGARRRGVGADDPDADAERIVVGGAPAGVVPSAAAIVVPTETALWAPAPNPASGQTLLRYGLAEAGAVRLAVYDALGREVALVADGPLAEGVHAAPLDVSRLAPGVYVVHLSAGSARARQRLVVTR